MNEGKLEPPGWPTTYSLDAARRQFMRAALRLQPAIETDLHVRFGRKGQPLEAGEPLVKAIDNWVARWAVKWHLEDDWCRDWATDKVRENQPACRITSSSGKTYVFHTAVKLMARPFEAAPFAVDQEFDPNRETPGQFATRVQAAARQHATAEIARAAQMGYEPVAHERKAEHFYWTAGFQILGWSRNAIARAVGCSRSAVIDGIKGVADYIGLRLRDDTPDSKQASDEIRRVLKTLPRQD